MLCKKILSSSLSALHKKSVLLLVKAADELGQDEKAEPPPSFGYLLPTTE